MCGYDQIFHFQNICKLTQLILVNMHSATGVRKKKKKKKKELRRKYNYIRRVRKMWILIIPPPSLVVRKELKS